MMQFHPDKCEVISISRKKNPITHTYTIHSHHLKHTNCIKYLGLTISKDLRWNKHVDKVVAKANNTLNFLRCNINIRSHASKSLVRPLLEYTAVPYGTPTLKILSRNWKWYNVGLHDLHSTNIVVLTVLQR